MKMTSLLTAEFASLFLAAPARAEGPAPMRSLQTDVRFTLTDMSERPAKDLAQTLNQIYIASLEIEGENFDGRCHMHIVEFFPMGRDFIVSGEFSCEQKVTGYKGAELTYTLLHSLAENEFSKRAGVKMEVSRVQPWPAVSGSN